MDSYHYSKKTSYHYNPNEQPAQNEKGINDSVYSRVPSIPTFSMKPVILQKTKIPPPFAYPKHTETSFSQPFSSSLKAPQNLNYKDSPSLADVKNDIQKLPPKKAIHPTVNPPKVDSPKIASPKTNPTKAVHRDQWWMEYDEYLGRYLK
jgi:hypothetical protein